MLNNFYQFISSVEADRRLILESLQKEAPRSLNLEIGILIQKGKEIEKLKKQQSYLSTEKIKEENNIVIKETLFDKLDFVYQKQYYQFTFQ